MAKDKKMNPILIIALIIGAIFIFRQGGVFTGGFVGDTSVEISAPDTVSPSSSFSLQYEILGLAPKYGVSVLSTVTSGGCTFAESGTNVQKLVVTSELIDSASCISPCIKTVNTPSTSATCTITNDYQIGTQSLVPITQSLTVDVQSAAPTCSSGVDISGDGVVDWTEINSAVSGWLSGSVDWTTINQAVSNWLNGC